MNIADLVFLCAAQEKSISKAAARAFVSQQCASKHIQNLENRYGVPLIQRRPHFALTEPGQELFRALQQIYLLESGVAGQHPERSFGPLRRTAQHPPAMRCFHQRLRRAAGPVPGRGMRLFLPGFSFAAGRSRPQPAHFYSAGAAGAASH